MMRRIAGLLSIGLLLVGLTGWTANLRAPISILGDADFTEENGVVGGTGTADDPYIIAGWEIQVPEGGRYGVRIENIASRFELRGVVIQYANEMIGAGIRIGFADGGVIRGCTVANSLNGIDIISSTDMVLEENALLTAGRGLRVVGDSVEQYRHQIPISNEHNGRSIHYYYGLEGETISGLKTGHLTVVNGRNLVISNNEIVNGDGLLLAFVEDSTVTLNVAHRLSNVVTEHGIHLVHSQSNEVYENVVKNNRLSGIQLTLSDNNRIRDNFSYVNDSGIRLVASSENTITGNDLYSTISGIALLGGSSRNTVYGNSIHDDRDRMAEGIVVEASADNQVEENLIYGGEIGIILEATATENYILANTVVSGAYGMAIAGSENTLERNLLSQHERGILFPETFTRTVTRENTFRGNVLADNPTQHLYTNKDSRGNRFTENAFLNNGVDLVSDQGEDNVWTVDGVGNYWGMGAVADADGDGLGDAPVTVYPAAGQDTAPWATVEAETLGLGILGTLPRQTATVETAAGDQVEVPVFVAASPHARATGFRGFPQELIEGFPGILFVFEGEVEAGFVMETVPFDLDIAFFTETGDWAGSTTMTAMGSDLYKAGAPYQYALELPSGTLKALGIGAGSRLIVP
jgi:parallel beta-helix repeat protein